MHPFLFYILRATAISGIFYGYYLLALRNRKLNNFNRFYLLASIGCSIILPIIHIEWQRAVITGNNGAIKILHAIQASGVEDERIVRPGLPFSTTDVLWIMYWCVVTVFALVTVRDIYGLYRIKKASPVTYENGVAIIDTQLSHAPFSFFNNIFWKSAIDRHSASGMAILRHELTHIRHRHTLDKLFTRGVLCFFWINPFYWLIQKELSLVHEFVADEEATKMGDTEIFALMLLESQFGNKIPGIIQPFFYSPIKTRILMLQKMNNTRYALLRKLLVLPVVIATFGLFSFVGKELNKDKARFKTVVVIDAGHGGADEGARGVAGVTEKELNLRIARELIHLAPEYRISVIPTRNDDRTCTLEDRIKISKNSSAQAFLSIHISKDDPEAGVYHAGYEVTVSNKAVKNKESLLLASSVVGQLNTMPVNTIKLMEKNLMVLRSNPLPGILIECGNIDNPDDVARIQDENKLEELCRKILAGIAAYANTDK